jgi:hypothetical protein
MTLLLKSKIQIQRLINRAKKMIKQKKYKDQWERLIHLKYEVNKIKENIILKDVFLFTTVFFYFYFFNYLL